MHKPFENLVIIDLSRYLLGAYASLYFADLGARVIKVEDTKTGDLVRGEEPKLDGESYYHYALNRNKESISLNLKDPEVLGRFYDLVKKADVLIENYRPGVTKRLGIDFETLHDINPDLVYVSFSAYGQDDPRSLDALHDINIVAKTGYYDLTQGAVALLQPADLSAAMVGIQGALTGLLIRDENGGSHIDVSMYDSTVWWNAMLDSRWFFYGKNLISNMREYPSVGYNIYRTKDGRMISFGLYEHNFWNDFCDDIDRPDLYNMLKDTPEENPIAYQAVVDFAASMTYAEWETWLEDKPYAIAPCLTKTEAIELAMKTDPHMINYVDFPRFGTALQTNTPHVIGKMRAHLEDAREPAELGASTRSVLSWLGSSDESIDAMLERGAIKCTPETDEIQPAIAIAC
ncbi:MAG: CaiB/BaiF CoA-transferase family protein [Eggerthellaceae bacterium]